MKHDLSSDDDALLKLIAADDQVAFNQLFERYRNRIYNYFVKVVKSKETAEEITLDIFMKIWTARKILNEINHFEAFLFRVAHNKAIDHIRMAQRSRLRQQEMWHEMNELGAADNADNILLKKDAESRLQHIINRLSPQRQEVFRLSRESYLSYDQIAERMNISRFTVRNHLNAALGFIRGNLDHGPEIASLVILATRNF